MRFLLVTPALLLLMAGEGTGAISTEESKRLQEASAVLAELHATPDNDVPAELWNKAECVAVIPSLKKAAFIIGGEYGKGVLSCRKPHGWSAPSFIELEKGSWGFQAGAQEVDLVLLVMNRRGIDKLLESKFTLGGDASVAAGPVGRTARAETDAKLTAGILAYARSRGLFAGIDLSGGALKPDKDANADAYGAGVSPRDILFGAKVKAPPEARVFMARLQRTNVAATTGER
jgi:lipid-binding SYLF domain-containing protein